MEGDDYLSDEEILRNRISIHTFRVEGDKKNPTTVDVNTNFNPHLPCGRWHSLSYLYLVQGKFQSTPSVWKVTIHLFRNTTRVIYFNPHRPCGRWPKFLCFFVVSTLFQSTPSVWKVTRLKIWHIITYQISIHTFRVEGDHSNKIIYNSLHWFQSTPSVWKVTDTLLFVVKIQVYISIHTFRVEGDIIFNFMKMYCPRFQSTPSVWKVTVLFDEFDKTFGISIHTFRVEGDRAFVFLI